MTTEANVVVALNGQINPNRQGGSESSVMSVVRNIGSRKQDISLKFISVPIFAEAVAKAAPDCAEVISWPFPMSLPVGKIVQSDRWVKVRAALGPLKPLFDESVGLVRLMKANRKLADADQCDGVLDKHDVDVVHFGWPLTFPTRRPFIYEPHDLQHRHYPEFFPPEVLRWRENIYGPACRKAAFIVCGTWWTKHDIMRQYDIPSERVAVIPRASVNARAAVSPEREAEIAQTYRLPDAFAFCPAMTFAHKNHKRLIEAIAYLRDFAGININLVCTGRKIQPTFGEVEALIKRRGLEDRVWFLGTVPDDVLTAIYKRAEMIVFPSLFEGHSQSLLEGLNLGLPIVGARQSSIPETVGDAGILFDGNDVRSIAVTLAEAGSRPDLLAEKAKATAKEMKRYCWDKATDTFIAVYRKAADRKLSSLQEDLLAYATRRDA